MAENPGVLLSAPPLGVQIQRSTVAEVPLPVRGQFSDSTATLYTAPAGGRLGQGAWLRCLVLCNTDSSAHTVTVYAVEDGGTADGTRAILYAEPLAAAGNAGCSVRITFGEDGLWLTAAETIQGLADAASLVTYRLDIVQRG